MVTRVLLLTQWFDPEPTIKGLVFARELVRQGFEVEVVTGFPNYPGGKIYPGYRINLIQRELVDGVSITRLPLYPDHGQSAIKRVLNYVSFSVSAFLYCVFFAKKADVIYAYHPPLTVGVVASLIRLIRRVPVVCDIQDMWPDTLRATGMLRNERILKIVGFVCNAVYRCVDQIVVLSPGFKKLLIERRVAPAKIEVIYNWADEASLQKYQKSNPSKIFEKSERFNILFAGTMGKAQAIDVILESAKLLQERNSRVCFTLLGGGIEVDLLKKRAENLRLRNVIFLPPVSMEKVGSFLSAADALLVHLRNDPLFKLTIPSKTQAYMAVGRPLLMAVDGDAADLVRNASAGIVACSEDPFDIANAAERLAAFDSIDLQKMGENARNFYSENLSLKTGVKKFGLLFNKLASQKK